MTRFLPLAAVALLASPSPAADPTPVAGVGIVSADQKLVFLPGQDGVEAVDLATGKLVWVCTETAKPAGASDKVVVGWAGDDKKPNTFRVVALDVATGKVLAQSYPTALPEWAVTQPVRGHTFRIAAKVDGDAVRVAWRAGAFYAGGAAPPEEVLAAAKKDAAGVTTLNLKTKLTAEADGKPKDDDFKAGPAGGGANKVGEYEFQVTEEVPGPKAAAAAETKVTFIVTRNKKELWRRELAGNPWSPPPP